MTTKPAEQAVSRLQRYLDQAPGLVRADAYRRYHELMERIPRALAEADFPSSLLSLSQIEVTHETRHSLLLAALLDPGRSGPLARWMWPRLMKLIAHKMPRAVSDKSDSPPQKALKAWNHLLKDDPELLRYMTVRPTKHKSEVEHLDVFARAGRADGDEKYKFGLVVEAKVKSTTGEHNDQLSRYPERIRDRFDKNLERTVFVFLTEAPREIETDQGEDGRGTEDDSRKFWVNLVWQDIADLLVTASNDTDLSLGYRLQAAHHADLIDEHILHRPSQGQARARLRRLRHDAGRLSEGDTAWKRYHSTIVDLWTSDRGSRPVSDNPGLSRLATHFLSHLDDIKAGRAALGADIQNLLAGLAKRARADGQRDVSADAHGVQRTWTVGTLNLPVVLRLSWAPDQDVLPKLSLNTKRPAELGEVFPADLMPNERLPTAKREALMKDTAGELWRLWFRAVAVVDEFVEAREIARRVAAVAVMQKVSRLLSAEMGKRNFPNTNLTMDPGKTKKNGKTWPCFVQWKFDPDQLDEAVYWDISYWPSGGGPAASGPGLALVVYFGEEILQHLGLREPPRYSNQPIVLDWSSKLVDFEGDADAISDLADKIVDESMELYADVLKKMGLVK